MTQTSFEARTAYEDLCENFFRGKTVVVTGASGYIGGALCRELSRFDCEIRAVSRSPRLSAPANVRPWLADLTKPEDFPGPFRDADIIFHLAAQTSANEAAKNSSEDYRRNVEPLIRMIQAVRENPHPPVIIFAGTATQAGITQTVPVDETHPDHPVTFYDLHKQMAEDYLKFVTRKGRAFGISLRLPNIYGPGGGESSPDRGALNQLIKKAKAGEPLPLYGSGEFLRDFLFIEDAVRAFLAAATFSAELSGEHIIVGSGRGYTFKQVLTILADEAFLVSGKRPEIRRVEAGSALSPIETRNFVAKSQKFFTITGWTAKTELREGLARGLKEFE